MTFARMQMYLWGVLLIPTLIWWADSILWVALMSDVALILSAQAADESRRDRREGCGCKCAEAEDQD